MGYSCSLAVIQGPIGNHGQALGCPGLLLGLLTTWKHLTFWVDIKKCENYTSKYLYMGFLSANAVNIWSNSIKLLLLLMDFGPSWAVRRTHRPLIGAVGHQPQLIASIFHRNFLPGAQRTDFWSSNMLILKGKKLKKNETQNLRKFFLAFKVISMLHILIFEGRNWILKSN